MSRAAHREGGGRAPTSRRCTVRPHELTRSCWGLRNTDILTAKTAGRMCARALTPLRRIRKIKMGGSSSSACRVQHPVRPSSPRLRRLLALATDALHSLRCLCPRRLMCVRVPGRSGLFSFLLATFACLEGPRLLFAFLRSRHSAVYVLLAALRCSLSQRCTAQRSLSAALAQRCARSLAHLRPSWSQGCRCGEYGRVPLYQKWQMAAAVTSPPPPAVVSWRSVRAECIVS